VDVAQPCADAQQVGGKTEPGSVTGVGDGLVDDPAEHDARGKQTDTDDDGDHQQCALDGTVAALDGFLPGQPAVVVDL
jgi:hypothetical protein